MTGLQLAAVAGLLVAAGLVGVAWWAIPGIPALGATLDQLASAGTPTVQPLAPVGTPGDDLQDRIGARLGALLPAQLWMTPTRELLLMRRSPANFYGEKILLALIGLVAPTLVTTLFGLVGVRLPIALPIAVTLAATVGLFLLPNLELKGRAKEARLEFNHALSSYIDLVALERRAGSGPRQALENAARVSRDHWVFARLAEGLMESSVDGRRPWDVFHTMSTELGLPELDDLANIMALAEEQSMPIYQTLRDHNRALRTAMLTDEQTRANAANIRLTVPTTGLVAVLVAIALGPPLMTLFTA
jgi:Type II secretion system (T2SS), protein F